MGRPLFVSVTPFGTPGYALEHFAHARAFAQSVQAPHVYLNFLYPHFFEGTANDLFCSYAPSGNIMDEPIFVQLLQYFEAHLAQFSAVGGISAPEILSNLMKDRAALLHCTNSEIRAALSGFGGALFDWARSEKPSPIPFELIRVIHEDHIELTSDERVASALNQDKMILLDGWGIHAFPVIQGDRKSTRLNSSHG